MHDLEGIALINQELLALVGVEHLLGVCRDKGIEEGIVIVHVCRALLLVV